MPIEGGLSVIITALRSILNDACIRRFRRDAAGRRFTRVLLMLLLSVPAASAATAATAPEAAGGEQFVAMAPCRLLDTRVDLAASSAEESLRTIDVRKHRCSLIVPAVAVAYAIRRTPYARVEAAPSQAAAPQPLQRLNANAPLHFSVGANEHVAIDLEGFYVPAGTPIDPMPSGASGAMAVTTNATGPSQPSVTGAGLRIHSESTDSVIGSSGSLYLDHSIYPYTGFMGIANGSWPWTIMKSGDSGGSGGFGVFSSNDVELLRVSSNGATRLKNATLSGVTDYHESQSIAGEVVHNVTIVNPKDHAGGSTKVVFFKAMSSDEADLPGQPSSPPTTKFEAFTMGYYAEQHINFDSRFVYHFPQFAQHYYYRAYFVNPQLPPGSTPDGTATYWVKPSTYGDSLTDTRADMWVSGKAAIGTLDNNSAIAQPGNQLYVRDPSSQATPPTVDSTVTTVIEQSAHAAAASLAIVGGRKLDSQNRPGFGRLYIGNYDEWDSTRLEGGAGKLTVFVRNAGAAATAALTVMPTGNVGIGQTNPAAKLDVNGSLNVSGTGTFNLIHAQYQDVAEWVPSGERLAPGTVVVIDGTGSNRVTPSSRAYDTAIAGVVSATPGVLLGEEAATKSQIATTGRVRVHVDASKSPIAAGDLLVTSDRPGTAMKSEPIDVGGVRIHRPGTLVGKALEPLPAGEGDILVLLSLQ